MREQVADEHLVCHAGGELGQPATDGVVEVEEALFLQQEDAHGGELFGHRGHAEVGERVDGCSCCGVGQAGGIAVDDLTVFGDRERKTRLICGLGVDKRIQPGFKVRLDMKGVDRK